MPSTLARKAVPPPVLTEDLLTLPRLRDHPILQDLHASLAALRARLVILAADVQAAKTTIAQLEGQERAGTDGTYSPSLELRDAEARVVELTREERVVTSTIYGTTETLLDTEGRLRRETEAAVQRALLPALDATVLLLQQLAAHNHTVAHLHGRLHRLTGASQFGHLVDHTLAARLAMVTRSAELLERGQAVGGGDA